MDGGVLGVGPECHMQRVFFLLADSLCRSQPKWSGLRETNLKINLSKGCWEKMMFECRQKENG